MSPARPNLGDVARVAGVHKATASRALNPATVHRVHPETARRVQLAAAKLDYRPNMNARGLRAGSTQSIGLLVPDILNPLYPPFIRGAEVNLAASGYTTLVANSEDEPEHERIAFGSLISRQVDGVIAGVTFEGRQLCIDAAGRGIPVVAMTPPLGVPGVGSVESDIRGGVERLVALLAGLGHRHIAHVAAPMRYSDSAIRRGYVHDAVASRLPDGPPLTVVVAEDLDVAGGERVASRLLADHPEVTAVLAYNDLLAIGVLHAVRAAGLSCPDDVTITGFNDVLMVEELTPPLTTVAIDTRREGVVAAEILLDMLAGEPAVDRALPVTVVERGSHGPARARRR